MSGFSRLAVAAVLVAGFGGIAQAQSYSRHAPAGQDRYEALYEGSYGNTGDTVGPSGTVPPSESHTVMGLRVPR